MKINPVFEDVASHEVQVEYSHLKNAFHTSSLPLFFLYIGAFPEYLSYITSQLVINVEHAGYKKMTKYISESIKDLTHESLTKSDERIHWEELYKNTPAFYHFQKNLQEIYRVNTELAIIFIALREAIKGWAVAAKKLEDCTYSESLHQNIPIKDEDFIFNQEFEYKDELSTEEKHRKITTSGSEVVINSSSPIQKDLLREYLSLCRNDFTLHMMDEEFVILRLGVEKMILSSLDSLPSVIHSPINTVLKLTTKYPNFPELLYLLSEHFPTCAVQRLLFSAYMSV
jgi:hypothetical protein